MLRGIDDLGRLKIRLESPERLDFISVPTKGDLIPRNVVLSYVTAQDSVAEPME